MSKPAPPLPICPRCGAVNGPATGRCYCVPGSLAYPPPACPGEVEPIVGYHVTYDDGRTEFVPARPQSGK